MNLTNTTHLISEIWKNKKSIAEGLKNNVFRKQHIEDLAQYRHSICETCIWNSKQYQAYDDVPDVIKDLRDQDWIEDCLKPNTENCLNCSCNIAIDSSIKLRSLSSKCPLPEPKWEQVLDDEDQIAKIYIMAAKNEDQ